MKGKGTISQAPGRRLRWILGAQLAWLALVGLLGAWWARFALTQAERITELERQLGLATLGESQWVRTQRMFFWESSTFFLLMVLSTSVLLYWYFRDERRARGLQAFFASVTHELKTPLAIIKGCATTLLGNSMRWDAATLREMLQMIDTQTDRLHDIRPRLAA